MEWVLIFLMWFAIAILILFFLLLFLPVSVDITNVGGEFKVKIKLWFLDFDYLKKIFSKSAKKKKKPSKPENKRGKYKDLIKYFRILIINSGRIVRLAIKNIVFNKLKLRICVGGEDASKVAVEYGEVCAIFYPAVAKFIDINEPKEYRMSVVPDFAGASIKFDVDISLKVRLFNFLIILIDIFKIMRSV